MRPSPVQREWNRIKIDRDDVRNRGPTLTAKEFSKEISVNYQAVLKALKEDGAPKPTITTRMNRMYYQAADLRLWWRGRNATLPA